MDSSEEIQSSSSFIIRLLAASPLSGQRVLQMVPLGPALNPLPSKAGPKMEAKFDMESICYALPLLHVLRLLAFALLRPAGWG